MVSALRKAGVPVLENEAVNVGRGLWVAGVADAGIRQPDLAAALAAPPTHAPVLLLSHSPDVFPEVPERVSLRSRATPTARRSTCRSCAT
jgi:predicted MPP superfamily phosphohydrolase